MSEEWLSRLIEDFSYRNLNLFFRSQCENYAEAPLDLSLYDDETFRDFQKWGEIRFDSGDKLVITSSLVSGDLSERSGKKAQYEKAKKTLKDLQIYDVGFFIFNDASGNFRFSLIYAQFQGVKRTFSNFRRFTYYVSKDQTNKTFRSRVGGCTFLNLEAVKDAFSVEKVNKEFYDHIAKFFYRLTGYECKGEMTLPSVSDDDKKTYQEFAVRLIGRAIFCWFLKHKKSVNGISLIPESILSSEAVKENSQYYHSTLEKLFFEVLNTPQEQRHKNILPDVGKIPFLNGGLFEPHKDDFYSGKPLYNLVIPDTWFEQFFEILEQYNFTIDENSTVDSDVSVDPEMLGRIFENLLAEVNPETGETARKATGSYYTPRTIVDYMVDQSLKQYLITKTKIDEDKVTALLSYEAPEVTLSESENNCIISALDEIKVIDPACGSGAFPMGILHKMLLVLQKADPDLKLWLKNHLGNIEPGIFKDKLLERIRNENWEYVRKLLIIQKSIYGVDIQTIAVEISKLRFFLSLIVDEQIDDLKKNRGVEALPNLEFKFVAANSLIELPSVINRQVGLGVNEEVTRLKELRNRYLRSYGREKKEIEEDFLKTRGKLIEQSINWGGKDALALQLANWNPFSNEASEWFDPGWMFGIDEGFDIVIANPPYIKEYVSRNAFDGLRNSPYYQGKMDIWYFFGCVGLDLTKVDGVECFIAQNNWVSNAGASKFRNKVIKESEIIQFIDFGNYKIFESSGIQTMVYLLVKSSAHPIYTVKYSKLLNDKTEKSTLERFLDARQSEEDFLKHEIQFMRGNYQDTYITFSNDEISLLISKINNRGNFHLAENEVAQGIVPNPDVVNKTNIKRIPRDTTSKLDINIGDGVFIVDKDKFANLSNAEKKYIKPVYEPSQLNKYHFNMNHDKEIIYISKNNFKDDCPNLLRHLQKYKDIMAKRRENIEGKLEYYHLHWPRNSVFFEQGPKILSIRKCQEPTFIYTELKAYVMMAINVIKSERINLKYLIALLNSKLIAFWLFHRGKRQGDIYQIDKEPLLNIPIKSIPKPEEKPFVELVDQIIAITKLVLPVWF